MTKKDRALATVIKTSFVMIGTFLFFGPLADNALAATLTNPIKFNDPAGLFGNLIKTALGILGSVAVFMIVYGGYMYLTSAGNEQRIKEAKAVITYSIIGIVLMLSAYLIVESLIIALGGQQ